MNNSTNFTMKKKCKNRRPTTLKRESSPIKPSPNRETLTYAQAQRMVELEVDGRVHRLSIYDKLDVITDDDPTAQEILECNSNKENNEKPQQVLVRSVRLKINQQKKSAALTASHGSSTGSLLEPKVRMVEYNLPVVPKRPAMYYKYSERTAEELDEEVEYDMDEEDYAWLELINEKRKSEGIGQVSHNLFEFLMDRFEKESFFSTQGQSDLQTLVDEDAVCCICMDGDGADSNVILFCDSCNIAVHQECYGVPYIPEGQWLCRHCLQRPSRPAECLFCPNRGGALKKTDDDRWGHVVCAMWVPEVGFSDTVFIEPIDGVCNIPPARWKLTCYLCKAKGAGACIQCDKINCYAAFHVSCAQKAGLYMKMEPVKELTESGATTFSVKKTAYCCSHTPEGCDRRPLNVYDELHPKNGGCHKRAEKRAKPRSKSWQRKKIKKAESEPELEPETQANPGPSITASSFDTILNQVAVQRKRQFVERVLSYWVLKRQSRNNVPLIRRLQANPQPSKAQQQKVRDGQNTDTAHMKLQQSVLEMQLTPFNILLRVVLNQLQEKDQYSIFAQPVSIKEVLDRLLTPSYRQQTPLEDQLKELLEKLDLSTAMKHSPSRTKRLKLLKKTIMEVRSEISLKKSLPHPPPSVPDLPPSPSQSEEKPSPEGPADSLPPPTLERLTTSSQHEISPNSSVPPSPKPATPVSELTPMQLDDNTSSSTSKPPYTPNEHLPDQLLPNSDFHTELTGNGNQRTNTLFRKSKSASPQKAPMTQEPAVSPPPLGAKTFLSVVIPRLETLLLPKKRTRSSSAEDEEEEETPIKRLGTGSDSKQHNHAVGKKMTFIPNKLSFSFTMFALSNRVRRTSFRHRKVEPPIPPLDVLRAGEQMQFRSAEKLFLVRFFDSKRSW
ncbi:hypothetical protein XENOCAPTIV_002653 [Xenoophorus captivus]|uniref:Bromodomain containing 1b n=1 Tax=Xenoophorus captivus TaxID=1517983 RepID=A0ABV0S6P2_9TELE